MTQSNIISFLRTGINNFERGNLAVAEDNFKKILQINPRHPDALHLLGIVASQKGDKKESVRLIKKAIKFAPKIAMYYRNLGLILMDLGKAKDAITHFKKAISIDGKDADVYNDLGTALSSVGRIPEAIEAYKDSLKVNPGNPLALNNLGNDLFQTEKFNEAKEAYLKAIDIDPRYSEAHFNLANAYAASGQFEEAIDSFNATISIKPEYVEAYYNLGNALSNNGQHNEAIKNYNKAIQLKPDYAEAFSNLCEIYEKQHMLAELESAIEQARGVLPSDEPWLLYRTAQLASRERRLEDTRDILESINLESAQPRLKISCAELLAKTYDKLGQFSLAFDQFELSNQLTTEFFNNPQASAQNYMDTVVRLSDAWSSAGKVNWPSIPNSENQPSLAFLVGFPRSGTTLLDTILRSHPDVSVVEEMPMVKAMKDHLADTASPELLTELSDEQVGELRKIYFDELHSSAEVDSANKLIIDKFPLNLMNVGLIHRVFPDAKFILALRHPCDCVLSCFMQYFKVNEAMANFLDLQQSAKLYDAVMKLWEHYNNALDLEVESLKYEDLVQDLQGTVEPILNFLDLEWDDNLFDYQKTAMSRGRINTPSYNQVTQGLYTQASGRWVNYKDRIEQIIPTLEPWAEKFGYKGGA
ncbi:tetratricopeptide repeat-containing sulfotransferase family protein [Solemya velum gill symbiont]|uniref:tetratricopeptide repeat-containing sulfotransferase family protein n=1 Tax=Solemya velum gill symbiont TaxID=2340 RepID=UPI000998BC12|nr:tetratricopeptide repeat-containing sulfotransferase family protein [Solemya velum gill symbiont]OOZ45551.1 hypothetical protein BOW37_03240 [Solemya velum gill symbiont]OOZ46466.1 hypothetical protein BOW38_07205 [Solemya velum gill symbiont]OOZ49433.1 hypothetical protein BOW39_05850 [Solemya velum gill symbiont]OOZ51913.1 hypothetical protein BOW40_04755 [Solemya velum gill symbiont]OOZ54651.1 hypothetical protein BOW41_05935 [Solemya velum gill symbiont]